MAVKEALYDHAALVHAGPSSLYGGCTGGVPNWFFIFWTPFMVFDTVLVLLVACKSFQHYHQVPNKQWFGARLVAVLARDSFVFFLVNLMIYLFNTMTWKLAPAGLSEMASFWWLAIPPISATRLLLNLRQVYTQDREIEIELLRSRNSRIRYLR
ncbi:hypothetical protein SERLA73DRAFT_188932 [Serpula lacrymans var. lacrymans S7.3]|uniref:Transmembrane protein n=2 Tax=Serpula lacrymans var. lacrymans TaxID=341189 RepID=F8QCG2_SERL3|nr:uncharacterized protein SERLADRAFT_479544 [Serpula lacrymans var. lacrymans S7.9]EGN93827.1 hypothetical protein SERLA73DRAFT_188932 [Serpula lacrymans var. lacrymans S7.3]EGO19195.1 hypothetical protein SERLADRAFT_479544 [Serpula lacrymans var. lacrymans S7.9]